MANRVSVSDLQALEDFRQHLVRFNRDLKDELGRMRGHWKSLEPIWSDDMYRRLGDALDQMTPGIDRYLASTGGHEAYLREFIKRVQSVIDIRGAW